MLVNVETKNSSKSTKLNRAVPVFQSDEVLQRRSAVHMYLSSEGEYSQSLVVTQRHQMNSEPGVPLLA